MPLFLSDVAVHMLHEIDQNAFSGLSSRDHDENLIVVLSVYKYLLGIQPFIRSMSL